MRKFARASRWQRSTPSLLRWIKLKRTQKQTMILVLLSRKKPAFFPLRALQSPMPSPALNRKTTPRDKFLSDVRRESVSRWACRHSLFRHSLFRAGMLEKRERGPEPMMWPAQRHAFVGARSLFFAIDLRTPFTGRGAFARDTGGPLMRPAISLWPEYLPKLDQWVGSRDAQGLLDSQRRPAKLTTTAS